jgi:hypothetical protein
MEQVSRIRFTRKQRAELWERWKNGQCVTLPGHSSEETRAAYIGYWLSRVGSRRHHAGELQCH